MTSRSGAPTDTAAYARRVTAERREYRLRYLPSTDQWEVCSRADADEIVMSRGFDAGFVAVAAWVLERDAFARFGHNEKWVKSVDAESGDTVLDYGPAEALRRTTDDVA